MIGRFEEVWNFPHVLGAIDGKNIRIECPNLTGTSYHNYKRVFSMVLLAVCHAHALLFLILVAMEVTMIVSCFRIH